MKSELRISSDTDGQLDVAGIRQGEEDAEDAMLRARIEALETAAAVRNEELHRLQREMVARDHQIAQLQASLSQSESALVQRQEENAQTWAELSAQQRGSELLQRQLSSALEQCEAAERKLGENNEWVFRLSGERRAAEASVRRMEQDLLRLTKARESAETALAAEKNVFALRIEKMQAELEELEVSLGERDTALARQEVERQVLESRLAERFAELASLTQLMCDRDKAIEEARRELAENSEAAVRAEAERAEVERRLHECLTEIASLTRVVRERDEAIEDARRQLDEKDGIIRHTHADRAEIEGRLNERFGEIAKLTQILRQKDEAVRQQEERVQWMHQAAVVLLGGRESWKERFLALFSVNRRRRQQANRLQRQGLFDPQAYLVVNPDVERSAMDPLYHYVRHGFKEGRKRGS